MTRLQADEQRKADKIHTSYMPNLVVEWVSLSVLCPVHKKEPPHISRLCALGAHCNFYWILLNTKRPNCLSAPLLCTCISVRECVRLKLMLWWCCGSIRGNCGCGFNGVYHFIFLSQIYYFLITPLGVVWCKFFIFHFSFFFFAWPTAVVPRQQAACGYAVLE